MEPASFIALLFIAPFILGFLALAWSRLNWWGLGRFGCRLGSHQRPRDLEFLPRDLPDGRTVMFVMGRCPRCGTPVGQDGAGKWLEVP
jgi:hypothetical protein